MAPTAVSRYEHCFAAETVPTRVADCTKLPKLECVYAQQGIALPRASQSGEIALAGSRCLHSMLAAVPVLLALAFGIVTQKQVVSTVVPLSQW